MPKVKIICWDGRSYEREASEEEFDKMKKEGRVHQEYGEHPVFDFQIKSQEEYNQRRIDPNLQIKDQIENTGDTKMKFEKSSVIDGLIVIYPDIHHDYRGEFVETYNQIAHDHITSEAKFVVDDISVSRYKTMRGIHGDTKTIKLIQCLYGDIMYVVVDFRLNSPTFLKHQTFAINDKNRTQILVPAGCGNGHIVLSDTAIFHYKQSEYYGGEGSQFQYRWTQLIKDFNIRLPFHPNEAILSDRDANGTDLFEAIKWLNPSFSESEISYAVRTALEK